MHIKKQKTKNKHYLIENYKDMLKNPNFEQDYYSETTIGI